jgi:hypothetical protein
MAVPSLSSDSIGGARLLIATSLLLAAAYWRRRTRMAYA